jgi:hypothetical protein
MTEIQTKYSDEYIEYWGEVFLANPILRRRGVNFITFLVAPEEILAAVLTPQVADLGEFRPLLPAQRMAVARNDWVSKLARADWNLRRAMH